MHYEYSITLNFEYSYYYAYKSGKFLDYDDAYW